MGYLLLISFIIHAFTFVVIRQLKVNLDQSNADKENFEQQQKEIEELLAVYLIEIREENDKLIEMIDQNSKESEATKKDVVKIKNQTEPKEEPAVEKFQDYQPIEPELKEDTVEQSLAAQVLSLHENGASPEEIAKQLNRGKREVELFIKFHRNQTE